ncbi:MAG: hypothetical protein AAGM38_09265 [Pseudomonadota bacterium]
MNSWDPEEADIAQNFKKDGTFFYILGAKRVILKESLQAAPLWRDTKTLDPLCTDEFKELFESLGAKGIWFEKIEVS